MSRVYVCLCLLYIAHTGTVMPPLAHSVSVCNAVHCRRCRVQHVYRVDTFPGQESDRIFAVFRDRRTLSRGPGMRDAD